MKIENKQSQKRPFMTQSNLKVFKEKK